MSCPVVKMYGLANYLEFTRASQQFMYRLDEPGLNFSEALTLWTWIRFHPQSTGQWATALGKWGTIGDYGYILGKGDDDHLAFTISDDGTTNIFAQATAVDYTYTTGIWYFLAGRFTSGAEVALFIGRATDGWFKWFKNVTAIPAAIFPSTAAFQVGATDSMNPNYLDGDETAFGLSGECLPNMSDIYIQNMFSQSRPLFV